MGSWLTKRSYSYWGSFVADGQVLSAEAVVANRLLQLLCQLWEQVCSYCFLNL
jgi:hypothetical protein